MSKLICRDLWSTIDDLRKMLFVSAAQFGTYFSFFDGEKIDTVRRLMWFSRENRSERRIFFKINLFHIFGETYFCCFIKCIRFAVTVEYRRLVFTINNQILRRIECVSVYSYMLLVGKTCWYAPPSTYRYFEPFCIARNILQSLRSILSRQTYERKHQCRSPLPLFPVPLSVSLLSKYRILLYSGRYERSVLWRNVLKILSDTEK